MTGQDVRRNKRCIGTHIIYTMPLNPQAAQAHPTSRDYLKQAKESCSHASQHIYCNTKIFLFAYCDFISSDCKMATGSFTKKTSIEARS